ncbi:MAG: thioredoxin family protein [Acidobacteria bacterium]|nr:MAG: thioredoxin family protein [Acidobacteriota bacterium]TDI53438.1 MAG: thioredoxin family protein [Acidobacteriota bacterium]
MATTSTMLALGTEAPDFSLPDTVSGDVVSLADYSDKKGLLVMFICNHCPYVKHVRQELARLGSDYSNSGLGIVAISSNDIDAYPADSPEAMKTEAETFGYSFPYLYDETQMVAAAYTAMCTPDFFLFGAENKLAYRGRLDESRPDSGIPVTGKELRAAIDAVLAGDLVSDQQLPSMGCSIKWKSGSTPAYFTS